MRLTKLMGLAVTLVALAVTINALAFKTAVVTNGLTVTVDTSANAKLAIAAAAAPDPGISSSVTNGKYTLTVSDTMQPDSVYTFQDAFQVTNNDAANPITLTCSSSGFDAAVTVEVLDNTNTPACAGHAIAASTAEQFRLRVTVGSGFGGSLGSAANGSLVITGTR